MFNDAKIEITSINFFYGDAERHFHSEGSHGYNIKGTETGGSVEFKINEDDGSYISIAFVFDRREFQDYNSLIEYAYQALADRLIAYGKLGERLRVDEKDGQPPSETAPQAG